MQAEAFEGANAIARHSAEGVVVAGTEHRSSVVVPWRGAVAAWRPGAFDQLEEPDFAALLGWKPELIVFGSGARLRFPHPSLLRPLIERRIGIETMDTAAACRTYNVLLAEGRGVVAALLFGAAPERGA